MLLVKDELLVIIARFIMSLLQDASAERKKPAAHLSFHSFTLPPSGITRL